MATIKCPLSEAAVISREEPGLITSEGVMNYAEVDQVVEATRGALLAEGIGPGSRVAICMENDWRAVVLVPALWRIGAMVCPVDPGLPELTLSDRIDQMQCGVVLTLDGGIPCALAGDVACFAADRIVCQFSPVDEIPQLVPLSLQAPASMVWTSGTGGAPRVVVHSLANHYYGALGANRNLPVRSHESWLVSLPVHHVSGLALIYRCFLGGAAIIVPEPAEPLEEALEKYDPTHVSLVATQLRRLMDALPEGPEDLALKVILLGGGPAPAGLLEEAAAAGWPVYTTYGLTEMTSQVATLPRVYMEEKRGSAGPCLRHRELCIGPGGEILVRGQTRFLGYWHEGALVEPFDASGWYATGDLGELDEDGYLWVRGRKDNLFVSGGENIQPEEIEGYLKSLPSVADAVVVPVPNREYGHRPVAFVKLRGGHFDKDEVTAELEERLPRYKIPDAWHPWPEDLEEEGLKLNRHAFTERAAEAAG